MQLAHAGQDCQPAHIFNSVLSVVRSRAHLFPFEKNLQVLLPLVTVLGLSAPFGGSKSAVANSVLFSPLIVPKSVIQSVNLAI